MSTAAVHGQSSFLDAMDYAGPIGTDPTGEWAIERIKVDRSSTAAIRASIINRPIGDTEHLFTLSQRRIIATLENGQPIDSPIMWMSDTYAERDDCRELLRVVARAHRPTVLINGLGMGLVAAAALRLGAGHVDVVEVNAALADWMNPWLQEIAREHNATLTLHVADAFARAWAPTAHWSCAWHDIWPTITADNLPDMNRLERKYQAHVDWQASWCRSRCERHQEHIESSRQEVWA